MELTSMEWLPDQQKLVRFIHEMNVVRRFIASHPANHPLLVAAVERVASIAAELLTTAGTFSLGVTRDTLLLGTEPLAPTNSSCQTFARLLFSHGIAAITFSPDVTAAELHALNLHLGRKPAEVRKDGGITAQVVAAGVTRIQVREIDYDVFAATDDLDTEPDEDTTEEGLWYNFVQMLLAGVVDRSDQRWQGVDLEDVEILSQIVLEEGGVEHVRKLIANYSRALSSLSVKLRTDANRQYIRDMVVRVSHLLDGLSTELRQQFLQSTLTALAGHREMTRQVLEDMDPHLLLKTLHELSEQGMKMPPLVLGLVNALATTAGVALPAGLLREQETAEQLRQLFREDDLDQFVPEAYQETLQRILAKGEALLATAVQPPELAVLLQTTASDVLDAKTSDIIIEILKTCPDEEMVNAMKRNLLELCGYFLETGDFRRLIELHDRLAGEQTDPLMQEISQSILESFAEPTFIQEVFQGLSFWGKAKYADIQKLIATVGEPFVEPLLERLANEQNMSLRRFYMDRLVEIGPVIQAHLIEHLRDSRWFFVRNVLMMLRSVNNPHVCTQVRRLVKHAHPRVQTEAVRTLLHYGDAEADTILLQQLASSDEDVLHTAIQLAEQTRNPQVLARLLSLLDRGGVTNYEFKLKSAVVSSLGEIADPAALPRLEQILFSKSLLHAGHHNRLKAEIMRTLDRYQFVDVQALIKRIVEKGSNELACQAEEVYRSLQRKMHGNPVDSQSA